jgi:hypothetical protein
MHLKDRAPRHGTVVAYLALFTALGSTAYAATGGNLILGHANKAGHTTTLTNTGSGPALKLVTGKRGTPPLAVSNGTKITNLDADKLDGLNSTAFARSAAFRTLSFHASDSPSPTRHTLGTVLGDTISADCLLSGLNDNVQLQVYLKTSNGSWNAGYGSVINAGGTPTTDTNIATVPAGTYSTPTMIDFLSPLTNNTEQFPYRYTGHVDIIQLAPTKGHLIIHEIAQTTDNTCTLWVQSAPSS